MSVKTCLPLSSLTSHLSHCAHSPSQSSPLAVHPSGVMKLIPWISWLWLRSGTVALGVAEALAEGLGVALPGLSLLGANSLLGAEEVAGGSCAEQAAMSTA